MSSTTLAEAPPQNRPSALRAMASRFNVEPAQLLDTLKNTAFKGATDAQMMALCIVANEMGLNPFLREIYAFPDKQGGIVPVIGVDGWLNRINSHVAYDGMDKEFAFGPDGKPITCTVSIYRKDRSKPTKHTELLSECFRNTDPWKNQPTRMLGHRTLIQCARIAFGFSGGDPDEWEQPRQANGRVVESARPALFAPKADVAPFPLDSLPLATNGASAGPDAASPSNGAAGTNDSPPAGAANPQAPEGASGAETPPGKTPARRTAPKAETLTLSDERESTYQRLTRKIGEAGLVHVKVENWLSHNDFPPLSMLSQTDAEQVLELFGALESEAAK